ncbi:MAG TPA: TonB-dependent receptor, partial [Bryobacteraceae bacterium]|nr:TonB-dependent receptor [Bryobacteraceae bacterium]
VDPANAVIVGADATLKDQATGAERSVKTSGEGTFRFLDIGAGTYTLTIKATGFRTHVQKDIEVQTSATRDIGRVAMELGNITDQITVTADAANVELSSSEKAHSVDNTQIENIPSRGRDLFAFIGTLPGMIDTNNQNPGVGAGSHDFRNAYSVGGLSMNGNTSMMNVTVDGLTGMDVGCGNCLLEGNPNMDAVSEVKVLSSNYSAEYGRNSGGTITLATKSGTQSFHGSGWWQHRHEEFNANTFFNNIAGTQRAKYRFNIDGYSVGGPIFIPHHFNTNKTKLFFFASEEWSGLFPGASTILRNMPTALERTGDFSKTVDVNGKLIVVKDPQTQVQFPGNVIPSSRFDSTGVGEKILNFFPMPNYSPPPGNPNYLKYNYQALVGGKHPIRNDVARVDLNPTSKIAAYIRMVKDDDTTTDPLGGFDFVYSPQTHPVPSFNYSGAITYTIRPTLVNEFNFGKAGSDWNYYYNDPSNLTRSVFGNPPKLYPVQFNDPSTVSSLDGSNLHMYNFIPNVSFGSIPSSSTHVSLGRETPNPVHNYSIVDNISWIKGKHTIKTGIYEEYAWKYQPSGTAYLGSYNFGNDNNNTVFGSQNGYSNALLGYFASYSEQNLRLANIVDYWNSEWYVQDSWKASKRLTFDLGVRFYYQTPQVDENGTWAVFDPSKYDLSKAPRLYSPAIVNGKRLAQDPLTGATAPASAIGSYVPGSGDVANGMIPLGKGQDAYHQSPPIVAAPRIGFAYDLFGDGKTALRGGFGIFYNRVNGNSVYGMTGNPPNTVTATVYDGTIGSLTPGQGFSSPPNIRWYSDGQWDSERNASLGVQRNLGWGTTLDVSWVANWGVNQPWTYDLNQIPLGADFNPKNADPTKKNGVLPSVFERVNYPGWGSLTGQAWGGSTSYHSLQTQVQHRFRSGFEFNANYTWSHALGVTSFQPLVADNMAYNYGPLGTDRRHVFSLNYVYNLPGAGRKLNNKFIGFFTDHWVMSGILQKQSGSPFTPGFSTSPSKNITGTGSLGARIDVIGDANAAPPVQSVTGLPVEFNIAAFAEPAVGTIGNAGVNILRGPGWTNFDVNLAKRFPVGSERRAFVVRFEGYNVFNHPEFSGINTTATFNASGTQINNNFGVPNNTRPARILASVLRFEF